MELFSTENLIALIKTVGYLGVFGIIFAESGLLIGFFLPGDSLLFTAGFLASQNYLNIYFLIPIIFIGAILGDNVGYAFGYKMGEKVFKKEKSKFFHKNNLVKAEEFYKKYGIKTIVLARFIPLIRTFAPILAGVGRMHYTSFMLYNVLGAALWSLSVPLLGYYLGSFIPDVDRYIFPIILAIVALSISPSIIFAIQQYLSRLIKKRRARKSVL